MPGLLLRYRRVYNDIRRGLLAQGRLEPLPYLRLPCQRETPAPGLAVEPSARRPDHRLERPGVPVQHKGFAIDAGKLQRSCITLDFTLRDRLLRPFGRKRRCGLSRRKALRPLVQGFGRFGNDGILHVVDLLCGQKRRVGAHPCCNRTKGIRLDGPLRGYGLSAGRDRKIGCSRRSGKAERPAKNGFHAPLQRRCGRRRRDGPFIRPVRPHNDVLAGPKFQRRIPALRQAPSSLGGKSGLG